MVSGVARTIGRPKKSGLAETRREQILKEATSVFARSGFPNTDLQVVADNLGIGKGTIYRYFPTKQELFLAAVDRGMRLLHDKLESALEDAGVPLAQLEAAIRTYLAFFDKNPEIVELFVQERAEFRNREQATYFAHKEQNIERWHRLLKLLMKEGKLRVLPVRELSDFVSDLLYGMVFTNYFSGRKKPLAEQADYAIRIMYSGILAPGAAAPSSRRRTS